MIIWSSLSKETQDEIIERHLLGGEDINSLAAEFNLKATSLSRTMRKIKRKNFRVSKAPQDNTQVTQNTGQNFTTTIIGDLTPGSNPEHRSLYLSFDKPLTFLMFTDAHFPFNDPLATDCALRVIEALPHDIILNGGDTLDCHGLSKYGKDNANEFAINQATELQSWLAFAERVKLVSDKPMLSLFGNHVVRYMRWLYNNPAVMYMKEVQPDYIMKLEQFGWLPSVGEILVNGDITNPDFPSPELVIHHGTLSRKYAGSSARGESDKRWTSSISGHVHRLSVSYRKTEHNQILSAEAGTLRYLRAPYMTAPDWQHGMLHFTVVPGDVTYCTPLLIKNGTTYFEGQRI